MKIITYKPKTIYGVKFTCFWCSCEYVTDRDSMVRIYDDEKNSFYYMSTCPLCNTENTLSENTPFAEHSIEY